MNNNQNINNNPQVGMTNNIPMAPPVENNNFGTNKYIQNTASTSQNVVNTAAVQNQSVMNQGEPVVNNQMTQNTTEPNVTNTTNNQIKLGTTSNVTYADTIGNIEYNVSSEPQINYAEGSSSNQFINNTYNETSINDLNVDGTYNQMIASPDYINDPQVQENLNPKKKNTITITKELKTFFIIALILMVFIFLMPNLFDLVNKLRFR